MELRGVLTRRPSGISAAIVATAASVTAKVRRNGVRRWMAAGSSRRGAAANSGTQVSTGN
jgi:hypothetical protein